MVIVIIGILAGLISAAVVASIGAARRAVIRTEISQLEMALERYKTDVGEYPPDFSYLNEDNDSSNNTEAEIAAQRVLVRHLRKRFPRLQLTADDPATDDVNESWDDVVNTISTNYGGADITELDPAAALVFWLGGLPDNSPRPAGFHADPANPFRPGRPRTEPYYDFDPERLNMFDSAGIARYQYLPDLPAGLPPAPFIYFRSQRAPNGDRTYAFMHPNPSDNTQTLSAVRSWIGADTGRAVPYRRTSSTWMSESSYQIISSGLDGEFESPPPDNRPDPPAVVLDTPDDDGDGAPDEPDYEYPRFETGVHYTSGDYDNMANFAQGKLEDEL